MFEELPLLFRSEFVIEWNQNAACEKNGVSRNQPLGLIRHDDAGAIAGCETAILQSFGQRMRAFFEISISQPFFLSLAVRLDQAYFDRKLIQGIPQRLTNGLIFRKVQHYRRALIPSANDFRPLTPSTSSSV